MLAGAAELGASAPPWRIIAERKIEEWIERGGLENLPRKGALNLQDRPFVPFELRLAYDVLEQSGFAPDWMDLGRQVEAEIARLRVALRRWRREVRRAAANSETSLSSRFDDPEIAAHLSRVNGLIARFNVACPVARLHRRLLTVRSGEFADLVPIA